MAPRLRRFRLFSLSLCLIVLSAMAATAQTITFSSSPLLTATSGVAYIYNANAASDDGSKVKYSLRFGPSGMTVDVQTGYVGWVPTTEGEYDVEIRAELVDNPSVNATHGWKITVSKTLIHPGCTGNDVWLPVGRGLPGKSFAAVKMGGELYVLHKAGEGTMVNQLSKWNGSFWSYVTDYPVGSWSRLPMIAYKDAIYVGSHEGGSIGRWDGSNWSKLGTAEFESILDMEVVNDNLYVISMERNWSQKLARWDGTSWETLFEVDSSYIYKTPEGGVFKTIAALATLNDKLYVALSPQVAVQTMGLQYNELPLFELVDDVLLPVENRALTYSNDYETIDLIPHNGTLIFLTGNNVLQWDGMQTKSLEAPINRSPMVNPSFTSYNGELYAASSSTPPGQLLSTQIWRFDNSNWYPVSEVQGFTHGYLDKVGLQFIEYDGDLYAYSSLTQSCDVALNNIAVLGTEGELARVSGSVYHDDDRNCAVDPNEPGLKGEMVEILPGPYYVVTNDSGKYTTLLRPGTYTVSVEPKRNWVNSCALPAEVTLASPAAAVAGVEIGVDMIPGIYDVRSSIAVGRIRPGFDFAYTITYWNSGTESATGKVVFEYDNRLTYIFSATAADRHNGNILEWDFANLPIGESVSITVIMNTPATVELGTEICGYVDVELERKDRDEFLSDNRDSVCTNVTGSYDPNDIRVAPVRFDEEIGEAPLLPGDTVLSYLVRFQNTGTDTAFTVTVTDTLDASLLDIKSILLGAASHNFEFNISGSGFLTWTFKNIMLPDSGANELASHGYFKYSIRLNRGLAPMTMIPNRAAIYFDYNAPVITNTVVSLTSGTLSVGEGDETASSLAIYPNPVHGTSAISLTLSEREHVTLRLVDSKGSVIAILNDREMNAGEHSFQLNGNHLSSGAYYLILEKGGKKEIYPVVVN